MPETQTLAQLVRAKYPDAYKDLSDPALEKMVRAKYPGTYDAVPSTPETSPGASATPTWADKLGLKEGTASPVQGFLRGAGTGAVDLAQGATSDLANQLKDILAGLLQTADTEAGAKGAPAEEIGNKFVPEVPPSGSGTVGSLLPGVAQIAYGGVKGAEEIIPSAARAKQGFQSVMAVAKDIPVDVEAPGRVALKVMDLAERGGGSLPQPVRQFANWITNPKKGEMTYETARDFASGISRLSVNEFSRMSPSVAREVAGLRVTLNEAVAKAAQQAGKGEEYASAMKEYARAMKLKDAIDTAVSAAKKSAPYATAAAVGGGAGYWLTRQVRSLLGSE